MDGGLQRLPTGAWIAVLCIFIILLLILIWLAVHLYRSNNRLKHEINAKVDEDSEDSESGDDTDEMTSPSLTYFEKLGLESTIQLCISIPLITASLSFLSIFWATPTQPQSTVLRNWISSNSLPTIVTVTSLVIRAGILGQTALGISMIASLALEQFHGRIQDIPTLLIQRSTPGGTFDLLLVFGRRIFGPRGQRPIQLLIPLLLLATTSTGLQFTSTILLWDLNAGDVASPPKTEPLPLGYSKTFAIQHNSHVDYAGSPPVSLPPFAEASLDTPETYQTIDYTGLSLRAFLPFTSQAARLSLRKFRGYTTIMNTTTLCVNPPIQELTIRPTPDSSSRHLSMNITFNVPEIIRQLTISGFNASEFFNDRGYSQREIEEPRGPTETLSGTFSCIIHAAFLKGYSVENNDRSLARNLCSLGGTGTFLFVSEDFNENAIHDGGNLTLHRFDQDESLWQVGDTSEVTMSTYKEAWTTVAYKANPSVRFNMSLCASILQPGYQLVDISSDSSLKEQSLSMHNSPQVPNPTNLLQWLGATNYSLSLGNRGVMLLTNVTADDHRPQPNHWLLDCPLSRNPLGKFFKDRTTTYNLCFLCDEGGADDNVAYLHPIYTAVIRQSLADSGPAKTLQAFWTLVYQSYYYDTLPFYDYMWNGTYESWVPVQVPVRRHGFITICSLAAIHLLLILSILSVFLRQTRFSRLHEPWLVFTQAWDGELADVLEDAARRRISDPAQVFQPQNRGDEIVGLDLDALNRAVGLRKRPKNRVESDSSDDEF